MLCAFVSVNFASPDSPETPWSLISIFVPGFVKLVYLFKNNLHITVTKPNSHPVSSSILFRATSYQCYPLKSFALCCLHSITRSRLCKLSLKILPELTFPVFNFLALPFHLFPVFRPLFYLTFPPFYSFLPFRPSFPSISLPFIFPLFLSISPFKCNRFILIVFLSIEWRFVREFRCGFKLRVNAHLIII